MQVVKLYKKLYDGAYRIKISKSQQRIWIERYTDEPELKKQGVAWINQYDFYIANELPAILAAIKKEAPDERKDV